MAIFEHQGPLFRHEALFPEIPLSEETISEPYPLSNIEDLFYFLQKAKIEQIDCPYQIIGLIGISKWIGNVQNGGAKQFFCNEISNYIDDINFLSLKICFIRQCLREMKCSNYIEIFDETIEAIAFEGEKHISSNMLLNLVSTDLTKYLDGIFYNNQNEEELNTALVTYISNLPDAVFIGYGELQ